jgi:hypothetical protein
MLPLLVRTIIFRQRKRRRRHRTGVIFRFFGFISVLVFFSLGGFRYNGGQISQKRSCLWKRRA